MEARITFRAATEGAGMVAEEQLAGRPPTASAIGCTGSRIAERVDEHDRPVPPGTIGATLLVTVLFRRTQPSIRDEVSDRVARSTETFDCGLPFAMLSAIEGRDAGRTQRRLDRRADIVEDDLPPRLDDEDAQPIRLLHDLPRAHGERLHHAMEHVRMHRAPRTLTRGQLQDVLGAAVPIAAEAGVTRTPLGKSPLVRALPVPPTSRRDVADPRMP